MLEKGFERKKGLEKEPLFHFSLFKIKIMGNDEISLFLGEISPKLAVMCFS